jgi:hypothetical protein
VWFAMGSGMEIGGPFIPLGRRNVWREGNHWMDVDS